MKLGICPENVSDDLMIAAYLLDSSQGKYDPATLASKFLDIKLASEIINHEKLENWSINQFKTAKYADWIFQLAPILKEKIKADELEKVYKEIELPLAPILYEMEMAGMKVNREALRGFSDYVSTEMETLSQKIYALADQEFNINSPKQVAKVLQKLNIKTGKKTSTGQLSTSKDVLNELAEEYEIVRLIVEYRELEKLRASYADALPDLIDADGRIHCNLNQTITTTGRLSSSEPNLQNIPIRTELGRQIRNAFIPEKGNKLISADYSQLELRILAHITHDAVMTQAFREGKDIHAETARLIFGAKTEAELKEKRRLAKIVNFGIAYAVNPFGLSQRGDRRLLQNLPRHKEIHGRNTENSA
jgi:DNA polymerase-1